MHIIIYMTCKNKSQAKKIVALLLKDKLVACANIVSDIESMYWWEGKVNTDKEVLVILKSRKSMFAKIEKVIKTNHSYKVPEIIAVPLEKGSRDYLKWINDSTKRT